MCRLASCATLHAHRKGSSVCHPAYCTSCALKCSKARPQDLQRAAMLLTFICSPVKVAHAVARVRAGSPASSHGLLQVPATSTGVHAGARRSCPS